ncbi:hypothetical protein GALMADRAFT_1208337 [Galerina marginata CBS 339.88]|uniref:Uncharacterized protein n=1 Tax=Galerina marginata (strain CBS 339.88) TaxID=685588 RepID=A0A067SH47_GALM3|nr:hypothetical protein GALMADRAFT_1208337 [Galerina marginata CBS 339.88]
MQPQLVNFDRTCIGTMKKAINNFRDSRHVCEDAALCTSALLCNSCCVSNESESISKRACWCKCLSWNFSSPVIHSLFALFTASLFLYLR